MFRSCRRRLSRPIASPPASLGCRRARCVSRPCRPGRHRRHRRLLRHRIFAAFAASEADRRRFRAQIIAPSAADAIRRAPNRRCNEHVTAAKPPRSPTRRAAADQRQRGARRNRSAADQSRCPASSRRSGKIAAKLAVRRKACGGSPAASRAASPLADAHRPSQSKRRPHAAGHSPARHLPPEHARNARGAFSTRPR